MKVDLIALDLDGTLMDNDHLTISNRNISAIRKAHEKGTIIALASGRPLVFCKDIIYKLPFIRYCIFSNGGLIYDFQENKALENVCFSNEELKCLVDILKKHKLSVMIYSEGRAYCQSGVKLKNIHIPGPFLDKLRHDCIEIDDLYNKVLDFKIEKIDITGIEEKNQVAIEKELLGCGNIVITSSLPCNIELNSKNTNKGIGLEFLSDYLNINKENIMAFGDSENDIEMITFAGLSVAMENGIDRVKNIAKFIAPPNYRDGVGRIIEENILEN